MQIFIEDNFEEVMRSMRKDWQRLENVHMKMKMDIKNETIGIAKRIADLARENNKIKQRINEFAIRVKTFEINL